MLTRAAAMLLLAITLLQPVNALADRERGYRDHSGYNGHQTPLLLAQQSCISRQQAIQIARRQYDGKVLSATLVRGKNRSFYKVKVLTGKGRVKTVRIDARC